jgi:hypothetical protein
VLALQKIADAYIVALFEDTEVFVPFTRQGAHHFSQEYAAGKKDPGRENLGGHTGFI